MFESGEGTLTRCKQTGVVTVVLLVVLRLFAVVVVRGAAGRAALW